MKQRVSFLLILLLLSLLAACGGGTASVPTTPTVVSTPTSTPTSQAIPSALIGDYATTITKADIPKDSSVFPGRWTITFGDNGLFSVFHEGTGIAQTRYQVMQNQLTILDDASCQDFGPDAVTGTYTWMLEGKMLTLKAVHDTCPDRKLVLSIHLWVKQG